MGRRNQTKSNWALVIISIAFVAMAAIAVWLVAVWAMFRIVEQVGILWPVALIAPAFIAALCYLYASSVSKRIINAYMPRDNDIAPEDNATRIDSINTSTTKKDVTATFSRRCNTCGASFVANNQDDLDYKISYHVHEVTP